MSIESPPWRLSSNPSGQFFSDPQRPRVASKEESRAEATMSNIHPPPLLTPFRSRPSRIRLCRTNHPSSIFQPLGHAQKTSSKISGFRTPSPWSAPNPRNLPSFCQKLAEPLPPSHRRRHLCIAPKLNSPIGERHVTDKNHKC